MYATIVRVERVCSPTRDVSYVVNGVDYVASV